MEELAIAAILLLLLTVIVLSVLLSRQSDRMFRLRARLDESESRRREISNFLTRFSAGIKGEETSISNGSGLRAIADSVSDQSAGGREVVMPMSTKKEAEKLCGEYLAKVSSKDKKFKLSKPEVKGLIYIPCTVSGNRITCEPLDTMVPERMKNIDAGTVIKS